MDITLTTFAVSIMGSILTELLKYFPILKSKPIYKSLTAVFIMALGTLYIIGFDLSAWDWNLFGTIVLLSIANYKLIVKPAAKAVKLSTQL